MVSVATVMLIPAPACHTPKSSNLEIYYSSIFFYEDVITFLMQGLAFKFFYLGHSIFMIVVHLNGWFMLLEILH